MIRVRDSSYAEWVTVFCHRDIDYRTYFGTVDPPVYMLDFSEKKKYFDWFDTADWYLAKLEPEEFANILAWDVDSGPGALLWDGIEKDPDRQTTSIGKMAKRAIDIGYFSNGLAHPKQQFYYQAIENGYVPNGMNAILLRQLHGSTYYLQDGFGRCIPYMSLILEGKIKYTSLFAFVVDKKE